MAKRSSRDDRGSTSIVVVIVVVVEDSSVDGVGLRPASKDETNIKIRTSDKMMNESARESERASERASERERERRRREIKIAGKCFRNRTANKEESVR